MAQHSTRLARRLASSVPTTPSTRSIAPSFYTRPFASTSVTRRAPSLADIESGNGSTFDARQQEFRERLASQKAQQDSQSPHDASPTAVSASEVASATAKSAEQALNSPIIVGENREAARAAHNGSSSSGTEGSSGKKQGALSKLIHGTEEGRLHEQELERSFSQVLARGKYVHSITFHDVKHDKVDEYTELIGSFYPRAANDPSNKLKLVGSWRTEVGDCDTFGM